MRYKVFFVLFLCLFLTGCQAQHSNLDNEIMLKRQEDPFNEKLTSRLKCQLDPLKNAVLHFADPNIEAETRKILKKPVSDILIRDVLTITAFRYYGSPISTLTDLKWFTNLESISLTSCEITSLEGIEHLINLKELFVQHNNISNLDPISYLINLELLDCSYNNISNLAPLSNLINLEVLECVENNIRDYSALSGLINLKILRIGNNGVSKTDLSVLKNLTNLKVLVAHRCGIYDISVLSNMPDLDTLSISNNNVSDINCLRSLGNLTYLNLNSNKISDVSAIENLDQLESVYLGNNPIPRDSLLKFFDSIGLDYAIANQSVKINSKMPEFGIETLSYFKDDYYKVQTITITDNSTGEILQTILIPEYTFNGNTEITNWRNDILTFEDFNFDGYTDIRLYDSENSTYLTNYVYLLWNQELGLYQNDTQLSFIPESSFDEEEQLIYGFDRAGPYSSYYTYKYIENKLTLICHEEYVSLHSNNMDAYLESADIDKDEKEVMVYHEIVREFNEETGEMDITRDEYAFYSESSYLNQDAIIKIFDASSEIGNMISADQWP